MDELPQIERSVEVPAEPDEVWQRIVDGDVAEEWMGVRLEPRPGGRIHVPGRKVIGAVEEVVPGESITWSWREIDAEPSQVTIEVSRTDDGSQGTIVERLLEYQITNLPPVFFSKAA